MYYYIVLMYYYYSYYSHCYESVGKNLQRRLFYGEGVQTFDWQYYSSKYEDRVF